MTPQINDLSYYYEFVKPETAHCPEKRLSWNVTHNSQDRKHLQSKTRGNMLVKLGHFGPFLIKGFNRDFLKVK